MLGSDYLFFNLGLIAQVLNPLLDLLFLVQTVSYMAERVVGTGSFGIVFQVWGFNCTSISLIVIYLFGLTFCLLPFRQSALKLEKLWL